MQLQRLNRMSCSSLIRSKSLKTPVSFFLSGRFKSDYLHESIVPTDHFQKSLPRLPVPDLEKTCTRYLESQKAFLTPEKLTKTESYVNQFKSEVGKELQEKLKSYDLSNKHTSYITGFWFDMYFRDRRPVVLNHNPFMSFKPAPSPALNNQLVRATNMIVSTMKYCKTLRANLLEPEIYHLDPKKSDTVGFRKFVRLLPKAVSFYGAYWYKAFPLDMSQFPNLFNSTRIPKKDKDILYTDDKARHVVVIRNGNYYVFDCLDKDGNILPASQIMSNLKFILDDKSPPAGHSLGYLTSEERNTWAAARDALLSSGNGEQLEMIDTALFALCLDSEKATDEVSQIKQFLHGDAANRWYDKSFSLIMSPNGESCVNFEHSWGDGVAVMSYFNAVFNDSNTNPVATSTDIAGAEAKVTKLEFNLDQKNKADIEAAKTQFNEAIGRLELDFMEFQGLGKQTFKTRKLSPDSMMQLGFQMAYRKCYGETPATYESCSTSAFKHGRTETIRPATLATNKAFELFSKGASQEELLNALRHCSTVHGDLTKNAAMGQGWDRHFFALRKFAESSGLSVPLFEDEAYRNINAITLSTSTLSSPAVNAGAFAPVVPHGLGVGYGIHDDWLGSVVTGYKPNKKPQEFLEALRESFSQIRDVVS